MDWDAVLRLAGGLMIAGGGAAALILGPFRYIADKWLTSKFNEKLEKFKHEQQIEMENLRFKINSLFDRATKLHQREFEVVPTAWALLVDCKHQVSTFLAPLQQYADLDRMTAPQLDEFLEDSFLAKWQRDEIKTKSKKVDYYIDAVFYHRANEARKACREQYAYLQKNGMFIRREMKEQFEKISELVWSALIEHEVNQSDKPIPRLKDARDALKKEGEPLMKALEEAIHRALWEGSILLSKNAG